MDENPLSSQQQTQANRVAQAYLQDTAREQQHKLEKLEAMYAQAHHGLVSFLTLLDPDFIDTYLKQGQRINQLDDRIVQQRVISAIKALQSTVGILGVRNETSSNASSESEQRLLEENRQLQDQLEQARRDILSLSEENARLQSQASVSLQVIQRAQVEEEQNLNSAEQILSPIDRGVPEPEWMAAWRQTKTFSRDSVFLCLVGETGLSRQPSITKLAALKLDLRLDNGSLSKPMERLSDPDGPKLLECIEDFEKLGSDAEGAMPKFYRLTDLGTYHSFLTDLEELQDKKRGKDGSLWIYQR